MYQDYTKRLLDLTFATITIVIASPIAVVVAIAIKMESPGPVIFKQKRTGLNGEVFYLRKFRSMTANNNILDKSVQNEITRVGRVLRRTSLDEIPQLINVLRGEMSFIGPRPWITAYYDAMNSEQRKRYSVRPGITGLAQAYGRNSLSIHQKIAYDLEYVENLSFMMDARVIAVTIRTLFHKSTHDIDKNGIHNELDILRKQMSTGMAENASERQNSTSKVEV